MCRNMRNMQNIDMEAAADSAGLTHSSIGTARRRRSVAKLSQQPAAPSERHDHDNLASGTLDAGTLDLQVNGLVSFGFEASICVRSITPSQAAAFLNDAANATAVCIGVVATVTQRAHSHDPFMGQRKRLLAYVVFLVVFLLASLSARPTASIYNQVRSYFLVFVPTIREIRDFYREMQRTNRESITLYQNMLLRTLLRLETFESMDHVSQLWQYMQQDYARAVFDPLIMPGSQTQVVELLCGFRVRQVGSANACSTAAAKLNDAFYHQIRVDPEPCPAALVDALNNAPGRSCFPSLANGKESTTPYGPEGQWQYAGPADGYDDALPGYVHTEGYPLGGYVAAPCSNCSTEIGLRAHLALLENGGWIDAQTRAIIADVQVRSYFFVFVPTIREIRDFYREM
eukprot:SAG31_NODE_550_length_14214_cov_3.054269_10_plen_401_part_00